MDAIATPSRQLVRMRGRSYVAFVFCPTVPIQGWLEEIDATLARSPGFFVGKPVVLDLSAVDLSQSAIAHLVASLEQREAGDEMGNGGLAEVDGGKIEHHRLADEKAGRARQRGVDFLEPALDRNGRAEHECNVGTAPHANQLA